MTTSHVAPTDSSPNATRESAMAEVALASKAMYDAEIALHIARQTGVDTWIAAAYDHLHEAIAHHLALCGAR